MRGHQKTWYDPNDDVRTPRVSNDVEPYLTRTRVCPRAYRAVRVARRVVPRRNNNAW